MSRAATIECPATPEHIDQCPSTPDRRPSNGSDGRSSPSSVSENLERHGSHSNCAICLGQCVNKCFTDNCVHYFCFNCLLEWSKIKAECPLCKQPFKSIIHNVRSATQYEQYIVTQPHRPPPPPLFHRLNVLLSERPRFRYRATLQVRQHESEAIQQLFLQQGGHDHVYYERYMPPRTQNTRLRRQVYECRMYALPVTDPAGRERECSAEFYRENPAQVHRLMPWVSREIMILSNNITHRAEFIISLIQNILPEFDIASQQFFDLLEPHLLDRTRHFIHEFLIFARSPYDLYGYDRYVRYQHGYNPLNEDGTVVISTSSSEEEDDDVRVITRRGRTEFTIETRSNLSTVILMGSLERVNSSTAENNDESIVITEDNNDVALPTNSSTNNNNTNDSSEVPPAEVVNGSPVIESLLTDSDSDDCFFVREQKPPHLRTPELVVLNSNDEDSDVVFVDENVPSSSAERESLPPKKRPRVESDAVTDREVQIEIANDNLYSSLKIEDQKPSTSTKNWIEIENKVTEQENKDLNSFKNEPSTSGNIEENLTTQHQGQPKKFYCPPIRLYKTNIRNRKRLYESSSSADSESSSESSDERNKTPSTEINSSSSHEQFTIYSTSKRKKRAAAPPKITKSKKRVSSKKNRYKIGKNSNTSGSNNINNTNEAASTSTSNNKNKLTKKNKKKYKKIKSAVVKRRFSETDSESDNRSASSNNTASSSWESPLISLIKRDHRNTLKDQSKHNNTKSGRSKSKTITSSSSDDSSDS